MADFSNFELGQNVGELADGLLPEMAEVFEVSLDATPTEEQLGGLVGALGKKKTLRDNEEGAKAWLTQVTGSEEAALDLAADWMDRSSVQLALDRALWSPEFETPDYAHIVMTGAVANWLDRTAHLVAGRPRTQVHIPVGNQVMGTATEKTNANVSVFFENESRYPTQAEYAEVFVKPLIEAAGSEVVVHPYDTDNGQEIAERFFDDESMLFVMGNYIAFARVANAGVQLACQFRQAAETLGFDSSSSDPQAFVLTDGFRVARTLDEAKDAPNFQNPFTGIRQIALTGKLLVEAARTS